VDYLLGRQEKGTWDEPHYTGTGFPGYGVGERTNLKKAGASLGQGAELTRGFMINYNMYRHYFPLIALGRARRHLEQTGSETEVRSFPQSVMVSPAGRKTLVR
jgi:squalene-hopene/tetraprenyl-beta-curcumene cyclase